MKYLLLMALFATGVQAEDSGGLGAIADAGLAAVSDVAANVCSVGDDDGD